MDHEIDFFHVDLLSRITSLIFFRVDKRNARKFLYAKVSTHKVYLKIVY